MIHAWNGNAKSELLHPRVGNNACMHHLETVEGLNVKHLRKLFIHVYVSIIIN